MVDNQCLTFLDGFLQQVFVYSGTCASLMSGKSVRHAVALFDWGHVQFFRGVSERCQDNRARLLLLLSCGCSETAEVAHNGHRWSIATAWREEAMSLSCLKAKTGAHTEAKCSKSRRRQDSHKTTKLHSRPTPRRQCGNVKFLVQMTTWLHPLVGRQSCRTLFARTRQH
eukprot:TRINITY_DN103005_c0_g1_i1.p1 TRINITY_DN103005_c0_g1~~TRINITY_DN103005_c0_g1_i1.p1  ORF type:complete len:169 (-),score=10.90 TRINITY_DN103005_c0_g1_i1:59-565(-)